MKVILSAFAWDKLRAYVDNCNDEIGGMGKLEVIEGNFYVTDIEIYEQIVTPGTVDLRAETLAKWQVEKIKKRESIAQYTFFWHSHAAMPVFFSSTDIDTITNSTEFPYLVSLVINHKHEMTARYDIYKPVHVNVLLVPVSIEATINLTLIEKCKKEILEKVKKPVYTVPKVGFHFPLRNERSTPLYSQEIPDLGMTYKTNLYNQLDTLKLQYTKVEKEYWKLVEGVSTKKNIQRIKHLENQLVKLSFKIDEAE